MRESTDYISSANSSIIGSSALYTSRAPPSMKVGINSRCYNLHPSMNNSFARLPEIEEYGKPYERVQDRYKDIKVKEEYNVRRSKS